MRTSVCMEVPFVDGVRRRGRRRCGCRYDNIARARITARAACAPSCRIRSLEQRRRVVAAAGVRGGDLDHGAARRGQPVEALARRQPADRPAPSAPPRRSRGIDARCARIVVEVERRVERRDARRVELDARLEEVARRARHDHADVDELLALDARHDADHRVVIRARIAHAAPPRRRRAAPAAARCR